jgi:hypothetical protein
MSNMTRLCIVVCVLTSMGMGQGAFGQTVPQGQGVPRSTAEVPSVAEDKWRFTVSPYVWMINTDATITAGGIKADAHSSFSDILSNLDFSGQVHFEAHKGKWGVFFDPTYLKLSSHADSPSYPNRDISVKFEQWLVEFGGVYELGKWSVDEDRSLSVDGLAGGRFWHFYTSVDTGTIWDSSRSTQWIDPIIGARMQATLSKNILFQIRGDVGGFGVGSDFSWNGQGIFGYQFTELLTAGVGYRALYVDYKSGSRTARYKATIKGPVVGLSFAF